MNRRDFLKTAAVVAAATQVLPLSAQEVANKLSAVSEGPQIDRKKYKDTGMTLPRLGYGMMRLPQKDHQIDYEKAEALVKRAMAAGLNYFDTAYPYHGGKSEVFCGDILSKFDRNTYYLTSKLPLWKLKEEADIEKTFNEQLAKCKTEYFDFYMLHSLNAGAWKKAINLHIYDKLKALKDAGKIRKLGFSFHDTPAALSKIANAYPWDFAQIQLNFMDWDLLQASKLYDILTKLNIPIIVMEPLRGGALVNLNEEANGILRKANPDATNANWAFRFVSSLPNVMITLSGMTKMEHLEENLKTFTNFKPLSEDEKKTLNEALMAFRKAGTIPCTGCRYCVPCPAGVDIPSIFNLFNMLKINKNKGQFQLGYNSIDRDSRADACEECETCLSKCPQKINIPAELAKIREELKNMK